MRVWRKGQCSAGGQAANPEGGSLQAKQNGPGEGDLREHGLHLSCAPGASFSGKKTSLSRKQEL